jgi:hypothetical protein
VHFSEPQNWPNLKHSFPETPLLKNTFSKIRQLEEAQARETKTETAPKSTLCTFVHFFKNIYFFGHFGRKFDFFENP